LVLKLYLIHGLDVVPLDGDVVRGRLLKNKTVDISHQLEDIPQSETKPVTKIKTIKVGTAF
jgi:hypothetical protein